MSMSLSGWLEHCERLHPAGIALGLDRVEAVRERLGLRFEVPVFTVAGTNGKGSTCAVIESVLIQAGYRVGVYGSPHLVHFEERLRVQGEVVAAELLVPHFEAVEAARDGVALTYFEFTTLALLRCLSLQPLDAVVLEVGLGGRLDAVNVIDPDCAVITSIDLDHMDFLGSDRESIGREKAGIMRAGRPVVVADPMPPRSVIEHAQALGADLWLQGSDFNYSGDRQQWSWAGRGRRHHALAYPALRGANQLLNASGAFAALEAMRSRLPVTAQAVRQGLAAVQLPGRFQIVPGQPALVLDVGHNPHAVAVLAQNLDQMAFYPRTHAVFGAMADKDLAGLITPLLPLVECWYCCDLPTPRAASAAALAAAIEAAVAAWPAGAAPLPAVRISCHADPSEALAAAVAAADPADRILAFGSFYTVGGVLRQGLPRLGAAHLPS
ncbi:dihydrofolate synthase/folylpolyglutamate synthase [Sphaerotilus hippei]|uniref:Dihydrofolate synthase/folylpolyglutamate synthase n=1 Tax=Sphaerotilus hippei TaxID=744406 RepID=A0A318H7W9_9BURK|nr:bifunctional tetrahydrofolate synthase/dihydrofolate synthase [Sphaerotilus hippei]PXW98764.1 dihydrofolate synthase/folylpolyglutamate synthase [Sphaerotilus hippei]